MLDRLLKRRKIDFSQAKSLSHELGMIVRNDGYSPEIVISIESGGLTPGLQISEFFGVEHTSLVVRRNFGFASKPPKNTCELYFNALYRGLLFNVFTPELWYRPDFDFSGKAVLVVDDAVNTKKTLEVVTDILIKEGISDLRTATLSIEGHKRPDYFVFNGRSQYPWSKDSKDYNRFIIYCRNHGFSV